MDMLALAETVTFLRIVIVYPLYLQASKRVKKTLGQCKKMWDELPDEEQHNIVSYEKKLRLIFKVMTANAVYTVFACAYPGVVTYLTYRIGLPYEKGLPYK